MRKLWRRNETVIESSNENLTFSSFSLIMGENKLWFRHEGLILRIFLIASKRSLWQLY